MTDFEPMFFPGERVHYKGRLSSNLVGRNGTVEAQTSVGNVEVLWDDLGVVRGVYPRNLRRLGASEIPNGTIDQISPFTVGSSSDNQKGNPKMQERFLTAYKDGADFTLTGDNAFNTQRCADNHANELAASTPDNTVVVLKVVSQHSSRIVVTTEAA